LSEGPTTFVKNKTGARDALLTDLLRRTAEGDRVSFTALYEKTSAKLFGIIRRICPSEDAAQEVLQETYLLIWRNAGSFDAQIASPITWMARIARNKAIDIRRLQSERISAMGVELDLDSPSLEPDACVIAEQNDSLRRMLECLGKLAEDRREMILLAYLRGLTRDEIATRFSRPANTVKTLLRRGLAQLKECIDGHD